MKELLLEVRNLGYTYSGGTRGLDGVSFELNRGEKLGIVGPNGAGKSTLLFAIDGLMDFSRLQGSICLGEELTPRTAARIRQRIGLVMQNPDDQLIGPTVLEDVGLGLWRKEFDPAEIRKRALLALEQMGIAGLSGRSPYRMSLGEKKRACLAGILASEPELLLVDEPVQGLDPRGKRDLIGILNGLEAAMIVTGHDMEMILETTERVILLDAGRIVRDGPTGEILADRTLLEDHGLVMPALLAGGIQ